MVVKALHNHRRRGPVHFGGHTHFLPVLSESRIHARIPASPENLAERGGGGGGVGGGWGGLMHEIVLSKQKRVNMFTL